MTDEELIARLRTMSTNINGWGHGAIAADRIEALLREALRDFDSNGNEPVDPWVQLARTHLGAKP